MATAMPVDAGRLRWDDRAADRVPGLALADAWVTRELTVRDILRHQLGFGDPGYLWYATDDSLASLLPRLRFVPAQTSLRAHFAYNNVGYALAGAAVAAAAGTSWDALVRDRLLAPLGMTDTRTRGALVPLGADAADAHDLVGDTLRPLPAWTRRAPAALAALGAAALELALPASISPGPRWLLPALAVALLVPTVVAHRTGKAWLDERLGVTLLVLLTAGILGTLALLGRATARHSEQPLSLLGSAMALWTRNVLVFASWYWRLDAGGPHARDRRARAGQRFHESAFLLPQLTLPDDAPTAAKHRPAVWRPGFVDYLFVAFNTSTAFSPTDAPVLARWAKWLMMLQASIALATLAVLAAWAVNIL